MRGVQGIRETCMTYKAETDPGKGSSWSGDRHRAGTDLRDGSSGQETCIYSKDESRAVGPGFRHTE